jgi:lysozyme family protein
MASASFDAALARVLAHEGGYSDHPSDPGGPTKFGITIAVYRRYVKRNATAADIKAMPVEDAKAIYRSGYWDALRCDDLPAGVDYAVFDYGVNSGIARSTKALQRILGVKADGVLGPLTIAAVTKRNPRRLINAICDERLRFLRSLRTWPVFGKGWTRRVADVRAAALVMAERALEAAPYPAVVSSSLPEGKGDPIMWALIKQWCKNSETIFWARLQVLLGSAAAIVMAVAADPSVNAAIQAVLKPEYVPYYVIAFGVLTEVLRRRRANDF